MRSAVITEIGRSPVPADSPHPGTPGPGEVLVRLGAAALNPFDIDVASGAHPHGTPLTPYIPGVEGVGVVVDGPADLLGSRVRVHGAGGFGPGTLAEFIRVPWQACAPVSEGLDDITAAALGMVSITALEVLRRTDLRAGDTVLVLGATGAVGRATIQIARAFDAGRIIAAGRDSAALSTVGADATVDLGRDGWHTTVGGPVDVVIDSLWGAYAAPAMAHLATGGRYMSVGSAAGATTPIDAGVLRRRRGSLLGFSMTQLGLDDVRDSYREATALAVTGRLRLPVEVHTLASVEHAWQAQRNPRGSKTVLTLTQSDQY
ncbi:quinone oxidoreductase family protein [Nocardia noduli]|uniref:quinone oxidoreductase family protein n=1 Tax=Nocardia noduli TaxID=2815722 RepID=UPI001C229741|nr:zinc-binding dehydrogenase [Nocardia noduli]